MIKIVSKTIYLLFLAGLLFQQAVLAEGTKEIMPTDTSYGRIEIYDYFSPFATFNCPAEDRLNFSIAGSNEVVYLGFGDVYDDIQTLKTDVIFRIKDPNGVVVYGPSYLPVSGNGYIQNYNQACAGPSSLCTGGYNPITFNPHTTGDFYIEFNYPDVSSSRREISYFDITVAENNQARPGRLWSKSWQFTVSGSMNSPIDMFQNPFHGKLFIYADDGIVTSVDLNGVQPYVFNVSSNQTGCLNTGNFLVDRKSVTGHHTYPQYKIFLNNPDTLLFPTGTLGNLTTPIAISGCRSDSIFIDFGVNIGGNIELLLNINGTPGYQANTEDRFIGMQASPGTNTFVWDGLDGLGNPVPFGTPFEIVLNYYNGLTNLPLYDVEYSDEGYIVDLVRPPGPKPKVFWDDSNLPAGSLELNGCSNPVGCHTWSYSTYALSNTGDMNTVNTWWYATSIVDTISYIHYFVHADANRMNPPGESNDTTFCLSQSIQLHGSITYAPEGEWSGGSGVFAPDNKDLDAVYYFSNYELAQGYARLILTSRGNDTCPPATDTMHINILPEPNPDIGPNRIICLNDSISLKATTENNIPPYTYIWGNGDSTQTIKVSPPYDKWYAVFVTDSNQCTGKDSVHITVHPLPWLQIRKEGNCITPEKPVVLHADTSDGKTFFWKHGPVDNTIVLKDTGFYEAVVINKYGCEQQAGILVQNCTELWVPNAFTPNGDGKNDVFYVCGMEILDFHLFIYNRWGELVFESRQIEKGWNGLFKGKECPSGVYTWILEFNSIRNYYAGHRGIKTGHVVLVR